MEWLSTRVPAAGLEILATHRVVLHLTSGQIQQRSKDFDWDSTSERMLES